MLFFFPLFINEIKNMINCEVLSRGKYQIPCMLLEVIGLECCSSKSYAVTRQTSVWFALNITWWWYSTTCGRIVILCNLPHQLTLLKGNVKKFPVPNKFQKLCMSRPLIWPRDMQKLPSTSVIYNERRLRQALGSKTIDKIPVDIESTSEKKDCL